MAPSIFFTLFHQNDAQCHEKIAVPMFTLHFFWVLKNVIWAQGSPKKHEKRQKKNELSMHTGINIPSRIPKTILKIQKKTSKKHTD